MEVAFTRQIQSFHLLYITQKSAIWISWNMAWFKSGSFLRKASMSHGEGTNAPIIFLRAVL